MTIGERIKDIRKEGGLTLVKFGERLGISPQAISYLEKGANAPSDQTIRSICREFHVNEDWLRTGAGDMRQPTTQDDLWKIIHSRGLGQADYVLISEIMDLPEDARKAIIAAVLRFADKVNHADPISEIAGESPVEERPSKHSEEERLSEEEIRRRVADYEASLRRRERLKDEIAEEKMKSAVIASGFKLSGTSGKPVTSGNTGETGGTA